MSAFKAKQPRANPPVCWGCDERLYAGGKIYDMVNGHPYHRRCAPESTAEVTATPSPMVEFHDEDGEI